MTSLAAAPRPVRNLQARTTVGILNIVRYVTVGVFGLTTLLFTIFLLAEVAHPYTSWLSITLGVMGAGLSLVLGAMGYAIIGWYVDSLNLLTQIANSAAR
jgi:hypothetical protein